MSLTLKLRLISCFMIAAYQREQQRGAISANGMIRFHFILRDSRRSKIASDAPLGGGVFWFGDEKFLLCACVCADSTQWLRDCDASARQNLKKQSSQTSCLFVCNIGFWFDIASKLKTFSMMSNVLKLATFPPRVRRVLVSSSGASRKFRASLLAVKSWFFSWFDRMCAVLVPSPGTSWEPWDSMQIHQCTHAVSSYDDHGLLQPPSSLTDWIYREDIACAAALRKLPRIVRCPLHIQNTS